MSHLYIYSIFCADMLSEIRVKFSGVTGWQWSLSTGTDGTSVVVQERLVCLVGTEKL